MLSGEEIRGAIVRGIEHEALGGRVQQLFAEVAPSVLSRNHERKPDSLRISDAGKCSLELWAALNGKHDIPERAKDRARMANGQLMGAWLACCLKAGLESLRPELRTLVENTVSHDKIPGHVDATILSSLLTAEATCEFKWTAWTGDWRGDCKPAHRIQSGKYALAENAPQHFVVNYYAASPESIYIKDLDGPGKGGRIPGEWLVVHEFETEDTRYEVRDEYARLAKALTAKAPAPDPPEAWNCKYCRFSGCVKNVNPNRPSTDTAAQLAASLAS